MNQPAHDLNDETTQLGGVHIKYLYHCPRQLWLYTRGYRPEQRSDLVAFGEVVDDTTYTRRRDIDLGEAKIDWVTTGAVIHETKSSRAPAEAHTAQVRHYCLLLERRGVAVRGGTVHYPLIRRTTDVPWDTAARAEAEDAEARARTVIAAPTAPARLARPQCRGCSYLDYCWGD
ncbi:CRISPR-associated protein Cas4 [Streptomyces radicis]|uniref:Dna2/Cas4 domain-containing protein n=1 Tax=Streptomyces radicis TaxID=1750517 RepID=A0A3A9WE35_9ACTN|nr:CRISPR-associated protein Cas4 [Streptomyces radicis]RKN11581.1 Dna2/Cas4 domain-containing protein [Streptomyces radicis]RKN26401.1 Dna2/Cas4 domain-containing protein [Streptomyces radicis]